MATINVTTHMIIDGADGTRSPSFTLRNRVARAVWGFVWLALFRPSPRPLHVWRTTLLRLFGARIGDNVHVYPGVRIWAPWNLKIGSNSGIGSGVNLYSMAQITIGEHCVVSQGAHLCCGSHDYNSRHFQLIAIPIQVGDRTWICAEAFVGPGVAIHVGSVIGARAVLMRSTTVPWHIWSGHPAVKGRRRVSLDEDTF